MSTFSDLQNSNWKYVITHLEKMGGRFYDHHQFTTDSDYAACICSHVFLSKFYGNIGIRGNLGNYPGCNAQHMFHEKLMQDFGSNCFGRVFDKYSTFEEFMISQGVDPENTTCGTVAKHLNEFLDFEKNEDNVNKPLNITVHWKSNQKDFFPSIEAVREFFKWNPHRKNSYRKITETKLVPRTDYIEVVDTIEL